MERIVEREVSMKILSFGSLNIDYVYKVSHFVKKGETLSAEELNVYTGGKGLNQSIALSRAGMETYHAGAIGMDGLFLLDQLKEQEMRSYKMMKRAITVLFYLEELIRQSVRNK